MLKALRSLLGLSVAALGRNLVTLPQTMRPLPPVKQHKHGQDRGNVVNLTEEKLKSKPSKNYPFQSSRQIARFQRNYTSNNSGTIIALKREYK